MFSSFLRRISSQLGLRHRAQWAWAMYDWGNSAFATTVMAVLLPIYFFDVAAKVLPEHVRTAYWGYGSGLSLMFVAVLAPLLGAMADVFGKKKFFLAIFTLLGCVSTGALWFVGAGDWILAVAVYILANIGFAGAIIFYDSLLPHVSHDDVEAAKLSLAGYALGYLGGGLLLALNMLWMLKPAVWGFAGKGEAVRASFVSVAIWWGLFTVPLLLWVEEPAIHGDRATSWIDATSTAWQRLRVTFLEIRSYRRVLMFLVAFWLYSDAIGTIIKMSTTYGLEIGIDQNTLILAMLVVQILGLPFTFLYAPIAARFSAKSALVGTLVIYCGICVLGFRMSTPFDFWLLAILIAFVQGGSQALSRSIFSGMIPKERSSEFFSFFSASSKFAGIFGPLIFGAVAQVTGNGRMSILFLIAFFVIGGIMVARTDLSPRKRGE